MAPANYQWQWAAKPCRPRRAVRLVLALLLNLAIVALPQLAYASAGLAMAVDARTAAVSTRGHAITPWKQRHMALADRSLIDVGQENLSNVIGCHGVSWNTDHHHCSWNTSKSAQPVAGNPCISASPAQVLAQIKNETRWQQPGAPRVFVLSQIVDPTLPAARQYGWTDLTPDGYYTPFLDTWVQGLTLRVKLWFAEFKRLGGRLDVLLLDFEACDYLNAGRMGGQSNSLNQTRFGQAVVKMPQWPGLQEELTEMGREFGATFSNQDMDDMAHWGQNQSDFRQYVWNAVVVSLSTARALNTSVVEPILSLYPDAHISNCASSVRLAPAQRRIGL